MHKIDPTPTIIIAEDVPARVPGLFVESATADGLLVSTHAPYLDDAVGEILDRWNASTAGDVAQVPEILFELCRQEVIA
jgi:hypothetical protein